MSIMAKTPSGYKKIGSAYLGEQPVDKVFNANGDVVYALQRELTGVPPLLFKGKEQSELWNYRICGNTETKQRDYSGSSPLTVPVYDGELYNYRIYGDTVNGESVGDRTGNLFDVSSVYASGYIDDNGNIAIGQFGYEITTYDLIPIDQNSSYSIKICGKLNDNPGRRKIRVAFYDQEKIFISRTILGSAVVGESFIAINNSHFIRLSIDDGNTNIMLNSGSTPLPYEPYGYKVPITVTNSGTTSNETIYLPEPIKMVGSEAEYVDYYSQTVHRVRKNLLQNTAISQTTNGVTFTVNEDGSVTCNTDENGATDTVFFMIDENINYSGYLLSGCPQNGGVNSYLLRYQKPGIGYVEDYGNGVTLPEYGGGYIVIRINAGYTCNNLTFYPMIRKADIEDDTYEPYIETVDVPITVPALPISIGTNAVTVNTAVQPSNVEVSTDENVSVGDLVTSGQHAGEYKVPVTVEGKNLWGATIENGAISSNGVITVGDTDRLKSTGVVVSENTTYTLSTNVQIRFVCAYNGLDFVAKLVDYTPSGIATFYIPNGVDNIGICLGNAANTAISPEDVEYLQLEYGSTATPYEPYHAPVTTPIYLPEPLKMVGDEAEYIDYAEQKLHRVRKNLFGTELEQGNILNDGTLVDSESRLRTKNYLPCEQGKYVLSFSGENIKFSRRYYNSNYNLIGSTGWLTKNNTFNVYPTDAKYMKLNFAKDDITSDISPSDITNIQLEKGSMVTDYEPYIENSEVDVTLPALSTIKGTNTMSIDTEVQPSRMDIKGRIKSLT